MGKSLGNFITLEELFNKFDPMYVRYFILQFNYRTPVDFTLKAIEDAGVQFEKLRDSYNKLVEITNGQSKKAEKTEAVNILNNFIAAMDEDFNTPVAIAEMLKINKIVSSLNNDAKSMLLAQELLGVMMQMEFILGLKFEKTLVVKEENNNEEILANIIADVRTKLRTEKNYALSDYIRDELAKNGIVVSDKKV